MNKQERYINYVVEDLVKKTEIDYEEETIFLPFPLPFHSFTILFLSYPPFIFSKYIKNLYGTKDEEAQTIWDQYKERIQSLINNE